MTASRGRVQRRERSLPDMAIPVPERERWHPPDIPPAEHYKIHVPLPGLGRIIGWTDFDEAHRMTRFALMAQVFLAGAWWDVIRVDTCHDEVHAHYMYRTRDYEETEVLLPIHAQEDVDHGYQLAETLIIASWADHVRRWRGGS